MSGLETRSSVEVLGISMPPDRVIYLAGPYTAFEDKLLDKSYTIRANTGGLALYHFALSRFWLVNCLPLMTCGLCRTAYHRNVSHEAWMGRCYNLIDASDAVMVIPHDFHSNGVALERVYAKNTHKEVFDLPRLSAPFARQLLNDMASISRHFPHYHHVLDYMELEGYLD